MKLLSLLTVAASACALALQRRGSGWDYENDKIRGVNLGGWFVLEPYITPSLFQAFGEGDEVPVDEYHYTQKLGKQEAAKRLQHHWATWYTEDDFAKMADAGLNFVRIPVGYWAYELLDNDPYVQGQDKYLEQCLEWCRKHGLKAWVDLHGAPGSQNGFDNSGLRDSYKFQTDENISVTLTVAQKLFDKYGAEKWEDVVIGIELLNEPLGPVIDMNQLKNYYHWAYGNMRSVSNNFVIIHDAFQQLGYWDNFMTVDQGFWDVVVDHHHYGVFSPDQLQQSIEQHVDVACQWGVNASREYHWNVCGEWSAALTDCALWVNGVGHGARWSGDYDNSPYIGSCAPYLDATKWPQEYHDKVRRYVEAQLDAFEMEGGWVFWNWKTESAPEWDMKKLIEVGAFPQPLTDRKYKNQCSKKQ